MNGILNLYKEQGFTSFDAVAKLRGILGMKKIGHTGTLDPAAEGVLPVALGNATKLCALLTDADKEYLAVLRLGLVTDTYDREGEVLRRDEEAARALSPEKIREVISSFVGDSYQLPPMYSAIKVNGKRLYELARKGQEVERTPRPIHISEIEVLGQEELNYTLRIVCSKGTYIRSLCYDIGERLGCGGMMAALTRTRVGSFLIEDALTLSRVEKIKNTNGEAGLLRVIQSVDTVLSDYAALTVGTDFVKAIQNGNKLPERAFLNDPFGQRAKVPNTKEQAYRIYDPAGRFYGLYRYDPRRRELLPVQMFL